MIYEYISRLLDWCKVNIFLLKRERQIYFREGEVWWCSIGLNIGEEIFGKGASFARPVLVFKKSTKNSFLALPFTGSPKEGTWYVPIELPNRRSSIMLNQAKVIDKMRLRDKITTLNPNDFQLVKRLFHEFYCP